jgi:hypothetical protein
MDNCKHAWGGWKTVKTNSDGSEEQERTCRICGKTEYRTIYN